MQREILFIAKHLLQTCYGLCTIYIFGTLITYFKALFTCQVFRVKTQLLGNPTPIIVVLTMSTTYGIDC